MSLSPEHQDALARMMMVFAGLSADDPILDLSPGEEAGPKVGLDDAERGRSATDNEMAAP